MASMSSLSMTVPSLSATRTDKICVWACLVNNSRDESAMPRRVVEVSVVRAQDVTPFFGWFPIGDAELFLDRKVLDPCDHAIEPSVRSASGIEDSHDGPPHETGVERRGAVPM